jgi:hypothetical protein
VSVWSPTKGTSHVENIASLDTPCQFRLNTLDAYPQATQPREGLPIALSMQKSKISELHSHFQMLDFDQFEAERQES